MRQASSKHMSNKIRQPAVAGQFYPDTITEIKNKIQKYLDRAANKQLTGKVKAIMVPHAGYEYSGPVAVAAYRQLKDKKYDTIVIIGNSHTAYFDGIAIDDSDYWQTPLGRVEVDKVLANKLVRSNYAIKMSGSVHLNDHVLEVQLPYLQTVLAGDFKIVPILFGNQRTNSYQALAQALVDNLGDNDLVIASSDMSHYPSYENAYDIDRKSLEIIKSGDINRLEMYIKEIESNNIPDEQTLFCGMDAIKTVMNLHQKKIWDEIEILEYANSGDISLDKTRVVGYGAIAFLETKPDFNRPAKNIKENQDNEALNENQKKILLDIAKESVESFVRTEIVPIFKINDIKLEEIRGAFVTIKKDNELRGCIGQIIPDNKSLWETVRDMAIEAATEDPRFVPVEPDELDSLQYEISVLSLPEAITDWQKVELGKHGVIIQQGYHSGVFLPQVAVETGWSKEEFLSQLCTQKAGLSPRCYTEKNTKIQVFSAQVF